MTAFLALLRRDIHVSLRNAPLLLVGTLTQPSLEDVYIHLTGKELRE